MDKSTFERTIRTIIAKYDKGYDNGEWRVKYDTIGEEYLCSWTNGHMGRPRKEMKAWYKEGVFIYY